MEHEYAPEVIEALATLRLFTGPAGAHILPGQVVQAINVLDDAGVFARLDEQTDYDTAENILAESAAQEQVKHSRGIAPEEALQVLHNTWQRHGRHGRPDPLAAVSRPGKMERVPGTDTLRPARQRLIGDALQRDEEQAPVSDEWSARARAIEDIRPKGRRTED